MDLRGASTVFDAVLFVLLVGVAVAALAGASPPADDGPGRLADESADVLATSTTEIEFSRSARILTDEGPVSVTVDRVARGTYAELLAAAAVADPSLEGDTLTGSGADLADAVAEAATRAVPAAEENVDVRAVWRPYGSDQLGGTVVVGERPPPNADVSVATVTVPSGFPNVSRRLDAETASFDRVAEVVASGVVRGLFPLEPTRDAMASEGADRVIVADRYETAFTTLGRSPDATVDVSNVAATNDRLERALAGAISDDLGNEFESPAAAARAVAVDEIRIVVRTWST